MLAADYEDDMLSRVTTTDTQSGVDEPAGEGEHDHETSDETDEPSKAGKAAKQEKKKRLARLRRKSIAVRAYDFVGKDSDVSGIIFMEVIKITDLPPERNSKNRTPLGYSPGADIHLVQ